MKYPRYSFWYYGPAEKCFMVFKDVRAFVASRIDTSDEAHYGEGTWVNFGNKIPNCRVDSVLHTESDVEWAEWQ